MAQARRPLGWPQTVALVVLGGVAVVAVAMQLEWGKPQLANRPSAEAPLVEALSELTSWPPELAARMDAVRDRLGRLTVPTSTPSVGQLPDGWRLVAINPLPPLPPTRAFLAEQATPCGICLTADCRTRATTTPRVALALYPATSTPSLLPLLEVPPTPGQCAPALAATSSTMTIVDLCANLPKCEAAQTIQHRLIERLTQTP